MPESSDDRGLALKRYREKRHAESTGEPFGSSGAVRPLFFVVQKHAATRLHYDLRLEWRGVLWSWAVPQGPALDPAEKRLAVQVEEHPIEYGDFEGVIPEGNYGAGAVISWDRGRWVPYDDPDEGLPAGKLHFELRGHKLGGLWTLVRLKGSGKDWLLIKKADAWADPEGARPFSQVSVLSGLTIEELRDGHSKARELRRAVESAGALPEPVDAKSVPVMLAGTTDAAFTDPDWVFEIKYDGFRLLVARNADGEPFLRYRSGLDATAIFPDLALALRHLPFPGVILDGEVVVLDDEGRPSFQHLQKRTQLRRRTDIERATVELPATLYVFDLLAYDGFDARPLPLETRKALLRHVVPEAGPLRYSDHIAEQGEAMYAQIERLGLEGLLAKKRTAPYAKGRSRDWLKILAARVSHFVIVGYTRPKSGRVGLGALHLALHTDRGLTYAGRVGTGFSDDLLRALRERLDALARPDPPCEGNVPTSDSHTWVEPRLVCEVRYKTFTEEGQLRHPVFLGLEEDLDPEEVRHPDHADTPDAAPDEIAPIEEVAEARVVKFTRPEKVFWPAEGYTKGDLVEFYAAISPWLLPYLADRPVVLTRYPDGIEGKNFFQKDAPGFTPGWVRTERMWSEHAQREIDYFVADNQETLLYLANLGTIPLHIWSSCVATLPHPDWTIIDLDPKGAPFTDVVALALATQRLCDDIGLACFAKTSGSTGMHVLVPLGRQVNYEQSRMLANLIALVVAAENPEIGTVTRTINAREGKVYLDFLQNGHGRLLVAPFSVRPREGATVSTPLHWDEVTPELDSDAFTIKTVPARFEALREDPMRGVLRLKPDLATALARLQERMGS